MADAPTPDQLDVLYLYLEFEASLEEARSRLRGMSVTRQHLEASLRRRREQYISEHDLQECKAMLFLNHAKDFDEKDEEVDSEWLNRVNLDLKPKDS
jgi:hypothetical protein